MDPRDLISFMRRYLVGFIVMIAVFVFLGWSYTSHYDLGESRADIFLTLGLSVENGLSIEELVTNESHNVVDQFTETVQGWLQNPSLLDRVNELAGEEVVISARKQEKQNLLVSLHLPLGHDLENARVAFITVLEEEINDYNEATYTSFVLALSSMMPFETASNLKLNILTSMMLGLFFYFLIFGLWEYLLRKVTFSFQVESLLGGIPLARMRASGDVDQMKGFLSFINKHSGSSVQLVSMGDCGWSSHKKKLLSMKMDLVQFPDELHAVKGATDSMVALVRLGVSVEDELRSLRSIVGGPVPFILIV
jgi:hypothetical protein